MSKDLLGSMVETAHRRNLGLVLVDASSADADELDELASLLWTLDAIEAARPRPDDPLRSVLVLPSRFRRDPRPEPSDPRSAIPPLLPAMRAPMVASETCSRCQERPRSGKNRWCSPCIAASRKRPANAKARTPANGAASQTAQTACAGCRERDKRIALLEGDAVYLKQQLVSCL